LLIGNEEQTGDWRFMCKELWCRRQLSDKDLTNLPVGKNLVLPIDQRESRDAENKSQAEWRLAGVDTKYLQIARREQKQNRGNGRKD
jgi:hypothetical protein